jgi:broad specificity phosphatase PhoE
MTGPDGGPRGAARRRLYLLRHGEVSYFGADGRPHRPDLVPLTAAGREQARAAGRLLAGVRFDRAITSGLPRSVETAELVLAESGATGGPEPEAWPELVELRPGRLAQIPDAELDAAFLTVFDGIEAALDRPWLGGETVRSLMDRVGTAMARLLDGLPGPGGTVLAVLHGGVNRAIISHALTGGAAFLGGLEQLPGCVNILDVADLGAAAPGARWAWTVRAVNVVPADPAQRATGRATTMESLLAEYRRLRQAAGG